jgi:light-regulated signal transduction histidine kinase (bacteriophytochrome)
MTSLGGDATFPMAGTTDLEAAADLTICDREPITRLQRIQSFGFLLATSSDWIVTDASDNLEEFLGIAAAAALGKPLDQLIEVDGLHEIRNRLHGVAASGAVERVYGISLSAGKPSFDIAVHYVGSSWIVEGEWAGLNNRVDAAFHVRKTISKLSGQPTLMLFYAEIARQIRALTTFDRVMVYQFSDAGSGEVVAEALRTGMPSFLGLHYPATDIPVQARALYLKNVFRIIADVDAPTPALLGVTSEPLDLSLAITRAVSPVHLEYMRNMGVRASLSISIIVEGGLWGLIACHNETPKLPSFVIRSAAELFGLMVSMTLESRLRLAALEYQRGAADMVARLVKSVANSRKLLSNAGWLAGMIGEVVSLDGLAVYLDGEVQSNGATPSAPYIEALVEVLNQMPPRQTFATSNVSALATDPPLPTEQVAGLLSIPIGRASTDYLLLFREEQVREIKWAGESVDAKSALAKDDPLRLSPRKSFAAFAQIVRGQSAPFSSDDQRTAEAIRAGLIEVVLRDSVDAEADRVRDGNRQELLIAELNHRVRNVLSLIRGLINQTQGEDGDSASYVRSLSGRVQALARAHDRVTRQNWGPGPFNAIFEDEVSAYVPTQRDRFTLTGPFVFLLPQAYSTLALVVHELVTNSSKYGSLSGDGRVEVTLRIEPDKGLHFRWCEMDGPPVVPPTRRGFGSVIIERVVPFDLQGTAEVIYAPSGIDAQFFVPEKFLTSGLGFVDVVATQPLTLPPATDTQDAKVLDAMQVLLLEDNLIVAIEAEEMLRALGAASVKTVSSVAAARALLESDAIEFAVLDINLGFETSFEFSARLRGAKIPFIFTSGYGAGPTPGGTLQRELVVSKPYDRDSLRAAIKSTLTAR